MHNCKDCKHWCIAKPLEDDYCDPVDDDGNRMNLNMPFKVNLCKNPKLLFCERPIEINGFAVADASQYHAQLITAELFGCVNFERKKKEKS